MALFRFFTPSRRNYTALTLSVWLGFSACSLNLSDPEEEARQKLDEKVVTELQTLQGLWAADSSYLPTDISPKKYGSVSPYRWEIYADSSYRLITGQDKILKSSFGRLRLVKDSLFLFANEGSAESESLEVNLSFLGNYLRMIRKGDRFYSFFHKIKAIDSSQWNSLLADSLWQIAYHKLPSGVNTRYDLNRDFVYYQFQSGNFQRRNYTDGLQRLDTGIWSLSGKQLDLSNDTSQRSAIEFPFRDTLRIWTTSDPTQSQGFLAFSRRSSLHPNYLPIDPYVGYWRADTMFINSKRLECHYGRFYDLKIDSNHQASSYTTLDWMPKPSTWHSDSGRFQMILAANDPLRTAKDSSFEFMLSSLPASRLELKSYGENKVRLESQQSNVRLVLTKQDPQDYLSKPFSRFSEAFFIQFVIDSDTLKYYFDHSSNKIQIQRRWESIQIDPNELTKDSAWALIQFPLSEANLYDSKSKLRILLSTALLSAKSQVLVADTSGVQELILRITNRPSGPYMEGLIEGKLLLATVDKQGGIPKGYIVHSDSVKSVSGSFRISSGNLNPVQSPYWASILP